MTRSYRLVGQLSADGANAPAFPGARALLERCGDRRPCSVERFEAPDATVDLVRVADHIEVPGRLDRWPTRWRGLAGTLGVCLGDPLAVPPAGDPGGFRTLHQRDEAWRWAVNLSGDNRCGLAGPVELDATADRVGAVGLTVDGVAWSDGGREVARDRARVWLREHARQRWPLADEAERAQLLAALAKDPDAATLVAELEATP